MRRPPVLLIILKHLLPGILNSLKAFIITALIIAADQFSKFWIMSSFERYETKAVIPGFFNLTYITNTGAAFGFLAGEAGQWRQVFFIAVATVALVILAFAYRHFMDRGRLAAMAICLLAGGAAGNLIDRLRFGSVVDFLDFYIGRYHWPAFNVADSSITIGISLFLLSSFLDRDKEPENN